MSDVAAWPRAPSTARIVIQDVQFDSWGQAFVHDTQQRDRCGRQLSFALATKVVINEFRFTNPASQHRCV